MFQYFLAEIQDDLNPEISKEQAIEMLAQHLITNQFLMRSSKTVHLPLRILFLRPWKRS